MLKRGNKRVRQIVGLRKVCIQYDPFEIVSNDTRYASAVDALRSYGVTNNRFFFFLLVFLSWSFFLVFSVGIFWSFFVGIFCWRSPAGILWLAISVGMFCWLFLVGVFLLPFFLLATSCWHFLVAIFSWHFLLAFFCCFFSFLLFIP